MEQSLEEALSDLVFQQLCARVPKVREIGWQRLPLDQQALGEADARFRAGLAMETMFTYHLDPSDKNSVSDVLDLAIAEAKKRMPPTETSHSRLLRRLQAAFATRYIGDAHVKFYKYLAGCWLSYKSTPSAFVAPYAALVQSSSFGKSRLVREVANMTKNDDPETLALLEKEHHVSMRVLYVCTRTNKRSSVPSGNGEVEGFFLRWSDQPGAYEDAASKSFPLCSGSMG